VRVVRGLLVNWYITHMRSSAIRSVRSQCWSQWERPNFESAPYQNQWTNMDIVSYMSLRPQGVDAQNLVW